MEFNATLVVMAAGMGSRFGGLKQIEPIGKGGEALLDFSVYDAMEAGFNKVVFVIKKEIEKDFKEIVGKRIEKKIKVEYAYQEKEDLPGGLVCPATRAKPWGTTQAVLSCKDVVNEPFVIINADDYYGKSAFKKIYDQLKADSSDYCMVGFRLENTLTENGSVSRGVCKTENGYLSDIDEVTKIYSDCTYENADGSKGQFDKDAVVSMNMWGLQPNIFAHLEEAFTEFLKENLNEPKKECYIPLVIGDLIKSGKEKVKVLVADDRWYGVTYREDKDAVVEAIGKLVDAGLYENI